MFFHIFATETITLRKMKIYRITNVTSQLIESLSRLLPQLSASATTPTIEELETLLSDNNTYLFAAEKDSIIAGILSLVVVNIPTGRKAWIEDVVVDVAYRGQNIAFELVEYAKNMALSLGVKRLYLTSNPSRKAAHALYRKCGFEEYDTTVFRVTPTTK